MPLEVPPEELFDKLVKTVIEINRGRGVLLLVDMGSLAMIEEKLIKATNIPIKTIRNVTTSMVLDVVRKINYMDLDLTGIYHSVVKDFLSTVQMQELSSGKCKAILSICTTGKGTAKKLEEMITRVVETQTEETIQIITVSSLHLKKELPDLLDQYQVIATVGTKNPKLDVPHVTLETLIDGSGEQLLRQLIGNVDARREVVQKDNVILRDLCQDTLNMYLVYLNPHHITDLLLDWIEELQAKLGRQFPNALSLKLIVHTAFAFERIVKQAPIEYTDEYRNELDPYVQLVDETLQTLEEQLKLPLVQDEKLFIAEILMDEP
ncbi:hypothetical protein IGI42_004265 [Enterococcus sp. AZ109]